MDSCDSSHRRASNSILRLDIGILRHSKAGSPNAGFVAHFAKSENVKRNWAEG
ncbi:unnamed protein product [marine sediment metagenome]|uniref:Uncharacterized protein n=1 Tax=marine sediment metagenome TaxID=412755 RepID=X1PB96_9ZZZZ